MTKIAQIGCGYWGKNLVRNFAQLGALSHIVDGNAELAAKMAAEFGAIPSSWGEVLADASVAGVSLATPAPTHATLAIEAFEAGKHVFVEKPLALTTEEARGVLEASRRTGKVLMVGHLLQYHPIFIKLREEIKAGRIGKLRYAYSNRLSLGKFRVEENVLWSFAPHDFSMILSLTDAPVSRVAAQSASYVTPGIADVSTTEIAFADGFSAHVFTSWMHPFKEQRLVAIGESGALVFEDSEPDWDRKLAFYGHKIDVSGAVPNPVKADLEYILVAKGEPLRDECQHFIDAIEGKIHARTDGDEAYRVLSVLEQAQSQLEN